jgi:sec-independent protein translocase protein TatA
MLHPVLGEIIGWELLLVIAVVVLLFGSTKLPKLARSLGSAKKEFEHGLKHGADPDDEPKTEA